MNKRKAAASAAAFRLAGGAVLAAQPGLGHNPSKIHALLTSHMINTLIPQPLSVQLAEGAFALTANTIITVSPASAAVTAVADYLAERLRPATNLALPVRPAATAVVAPALALALDATDAGLGEEGYALTIAPDGVGLKAYAPAGLFYGVQTLCQLLPPAVESATPQPGPWALPATRIRDTPRFAWRGLMLDVARHFLPVADVMRVIDLAAAYKLNRLHLHLTDDQGWRIDIASWPELARVGGQTAVGGGPGEPIRRPTTPPWPLTPPRAT